MGIPAHTRIILIPDDEQNSRQYGITRGMVLALLLLLFAAAVVLAILMVSFASKYNERQRIQELEQKLMVAADAVATATLLKTELDDMRQTQEKLLYMLGVDQTAAAEPDTLEAWLQSEPESAAEGLRRAAMVTFSPEPELWPATGYVTREFIAGNIARGVKPHLGLDIAGTQDSPILAAAEGVVARTGTDDFLGNYVEIQHGLGYLTVYGHCSRIAVSRGDKIIGGQVVAYMGDTGQSTATHLHLEIWHQGEAIDPRELLSGEPPQN